MKCIHCDIEFVLYPGKPGKVNECKDCANEPIVKLTGNMIYDHKTGCSIQINSDPTLTEYITKATKLMNKGSNLGNNLKVSGKTHRHNAMYKSADEKANVKGKL